MFMKQYNYKPRSGSSSSQNGSGSAVVEASKDDKPAAQSIAQAGRRRSSATEQFGGLAGLKRNSADQDAKKATFTEQKPGQAGVLGGMWNSFTKGS